MICIADDSYMDTILKDLNKTVENYIRQNLHNSSTEILSNIAPLSHKRQLKSCWEINSCDKKECPAYEVDDYRCWLKVGTLCGGGVQGIFAEKYNTCYNCPVFLQYNHSSIDALYENIAILIQHLGDKSLELREMAIKDSLTKCYNRYYLEQVSGYEEERAKRNGEPVSLILFDLDKFKEINDKQGHLAGDHVLKAFAQLLKTKTRESELVFRIGGDEFLILMPNCPEEKRVLAEQRLKELELAIHLPETDEELRCSFSLGGATSRGIPSIQKLLHSADMSMYSVKRQVNN